MKFIMNWIVSRPMTAAALMLAIVISLGMGGRQLRIDPSIDGLILDDADKAYHEQIKDVFGDDTVIMVVVHSDQLFSPPVIQSIENLSRALPEIALPLNNESFYPITSVRSLTTVNRVEGQKEEGSDEIYLDTSPLVDGVPETPEDCEALKQRTLKSDLFIGDIISADGKTAAVDGFLAAGPDGLDGYDVKVVDAVEKLLEQERVLLKKAGIQAELYSVGVPVAKVDLGNYINADMMRLVPFSLLLIFLVLGFSFRTFSAMVLPLISGVTSVIATLGLMGWMGYEINLISNIVPLLLLVIGCTEDIHLISEFAMEIRHGLPKRQAVRAMALKSGFPIFLTSLTTVLGFASLSTNSIHMLREFGIAAALGLCINFMTTIVVNPVALSFLPIPKAFLRQREAHTPGFITKLEHFLCYLFNQKRGLIFAVTIIVFLLSAWSASRVKLNTDLMSMFKPDAPIRTKMDLLAKELSGGQTFTIVIDTGREDGAKDPKVIRAMLQLQKEMEDGPFDKALSIGNYLRTMHREANGNDPAFDVIPDQGIAEYLMLLEGADLDRILESTYERTLIAVRHNINGSWELNREVEKLYERAKVLFPKYVQIKITGKGILFNKASDNMAWGQLSSLSLALFMIFIVIALLFVSAKAGVLAMIPNLLPIFTTFGLMGVLGIPLSPGTTMVSAIALGIAVDDTLHLMVSFHKNMKLVPNQALAMERTIHEMLLPVVSTSVALTFGFGILTLADVTTSRDFGFLASMAMISALISDLFLTPALLVATQLVSSWDLLQVRVNRELVAKSPLFGNFTTAELKRVMLLGMLEEYQAGQAVVKKGEQTREMYLLLEGNAGVQLGKNESAPLKPGDIFGEMAFVTGEARSADVLATDTLKVLKIDTNVLDRLQKRFPKIGCKLLLNISQILSRRLGETTKAIVH